MALDKNYRCQFSHPYRRLRYQFIFMVLKVYSFKQETVILMPRENLIWRCNFAAEDSRFALSVELKETADVHLQMVADHFTLPPQVNCCRLELRNPSLRSPTLIVAHQKLKEAPKYTRNHRNRCADDTRLDPGHVRPWPSTSRTKRTTMSANDQPINGIFNSPTTGRLTQPVGHLSLAGWAVLVHFSSNLYTSTDRARVGQRSVGRHYRLRGNRKLSQRTKCVLHIGSYLWLSARLRLIDNIAVPGTGIFSPSYICFEIGSILFDM